MGIVEDLLSAMQTAYEHYLAAKASARAARERGSDRRAAYHEARAQNFKKRENFFRKLLRERRERQQGRRQ